MQWLLAELAPDVNQKWQPTPNLPNPLLKSDKLPRLGKSHEPDRKGVERCWLLLRSHFEPIEPPPTVDEAEEKRKQEVAEAVTLDPSIRAALLPREDGRRRVPQTSSTGSAQVAGF